MPTMASATMTTTAPTRMAISVPEPPPDDGSSVGAGAGIGVAVASAAGAAVGAGADAGADVGGGGAAVGVGVAGSGVGVGVGVGSGTTPDWHGVRRQRRPCVVSEQQLDLHQARRAQVRVRERQRRLPSAIEVERYRQVEVGERRRPRDQARLSALEHAIANRHRPGRFPVADADGQRAFLHRLSVEQRRPLKQYRPRRYAPILILLLRQRGVPAQQRRYRQRKRQRHPPGAPSRSAYVLPLLLLLFLSSFLSNPHPNPLPV